MAIRVSIMGSTGSVGRSALSVIGHANSLSKDPMFALEAVTAHRDVDSLSKQAIAFGSKLAVIADENCYLM